MEAISGIHKSVSGLCVIMVTPRYVVIILLMPIVSVVDLFVITWVLVVYGLLSFICLISNRLVLLSPIDSLEQKRLSVVFVSLCIM